MSTPYQRPPEGDGRKRVAGVPKGGEQEAAGRPGTGRSRRAVAAQTSSASVRSVRVRPSASDASGVTIRVPTPASR